ncbi:RNA polymerase Rpb7-like domain-containing protein [Colletotrichum graminicola]|uniref:DNA-directed RNA polymerase subunit n=1 Tax=Colletotrichum graminicola (strain M1.001 / M2 / FGSC 10212) TaxID=645133 RepID=E3QKU1_COLGM|nr:RNA polymerase Rpb7-like domain-containing protein [Colletotrichum graminicola M1.001]EFQ31479.1 RNA polymerase Rpb7-like domain-containing protein [Colletotrichum graminicola M1.001]WDK19789.1 RNA polymerase Rpb7-like domain-containing protein [Colletotrichum graminicola]
MAAIVSPVTNGHKSDKKSKKDKKEKKRLREEEDAEAAEERKHKRTKSTVVVPDDDESPSGSQDLSLAPSAATNGEPSPEKKKKKDKKHKKSVGEAEEEGAASDAERKEQKDKKDKKKKRKPQKETEDDLEEPSIETTAAAAPASEKKEKKSKKAKTASPEPAADDKDDAMDVDSPARTKSTSRVHQPPDAPSKPQFPFFTQTVSLYLPIYPVGWDTPCTAAASQHLEPLVNRYVPELKGVLLAFRNVSLSEQPGRRHAATNDSEHCDLVSVDEYAVGFGYVTVDVDLFVPRRGAWMEGSINLESEGHIGVVCWGKFNASIESSRLPPEWRWVHAGSAEAASYVADPFDGDDAAAAEAEAEDEHGAVRQIHTTGFWVDGNGDKVKGRVRFRVKAFDVGVSGDHGYLSLEGTMLDAAGEKAATQRDAEQERRRRAGKSGVGAAAGILAKERRRMPEFSVTKFGAVEDEEDKALRKDVWDTTEPATESNEAGEKEAFAGISTEEA